MNECRSLEKEKKFLGIRGDVDQDDKRKET
jgi:hypothetical protein